MNAPICDITTYVLLDHDSVGSRGGHCQALALFLDSVVRPSLRALNAELENLRKSEDPTADFYLIDVQELLRETIEGHLLTVQSMWERGLRSMLVQRERKLHEGVRSQAIQRASWGVKPSDLQAHFLRLLGVPLQAFGSYIDLELLQSLGSAIRHGDGSAAKRVHQMSPSLWSTSSQVEDVPDISQADQTAPSFDRVNLTERVLEQMVQSVQWFWEDLENIRCNSFKRKHESVTKQLAAWQVDLRNRHRSRIWTPA